MTRNELLKDMSKRTDLDENICGLVIDTFAEEVKECLSKGERLMLKDFICFEVVEHPERKGRHPKTGEVVTFPPSATVKCSIGKSIKNAVREGVIENETFAF